MLNLIRILADIMRFEIFVYIIMSTSFKVSFYWGFKFSKPRFGAFPDQDLSSYL